MLRLNEFCFYLPEVQVATNPCLESIYLILFQRTLYWNVSLLHRKNKSFRPRERAKKGLKNLQTVKTLAGRTQSHGLPLGNKARKQPLTVTAQFQHSLHSLMDTLGHADPFFIRCIKSNAHKVHLFASNSK